jgi:membrane protein DedA with SNARE-associated domain
LLLEIEIIDRIIEWFGMLVEKYGPLGIAAAMFAESAGVPFASSVVIATSGGMFLSGKVSFWILLGSSTAGITLGSICSYLLGYLSKLASVPLARLFKRRCRPQSKIAARQNSRIYQFWERYGSFSIFMGQLWGVTRTFISFPAGAMKMNFPLFVLYTALGGAIFSAATIGFSILITSIFGLLLQFFGLLLTLPPWVWLIPLFLISAFVYVYRRRGWKLRLPEKLRLGWFFRKK